MPVTWKSAWRCSNPSRRRGLLKSGARNYQWRRECNVRCNDAAQPDRQVRDGKLEWQAVRAASLTSAVIGASCKPPPDFKHGLNMHIRDLKSTSSKLCGVSSTCGTAGRR